MNPLLKTFDLATKQIDVELKLRRENGMLRSVIRTLNEEIRELNDKYISSLDDFGFWDYYHSKTQKGK